MTTNILVKLGKWLITKFGNKTVQGQMQAQSVTQNVPTQIINLIQINNGRLEDLKSKTFETLTTIAKEYNIPTPTMKPYYDLVDSSASPSDFIFNTGIATGATAAASGYNYKEVANKLGNAFSKKNCPKCNTTLVSTTGEFCPNCGNKFT